MKRLLALVIVLGLGGWVAIGAIGARPDRAAAQSPAIEIHRVQKAGFLPTPGSDGEPIFILALGSDARPGQDIERQRADSIHIVAINPEERAVTILGFPRDSYVPIPGVGTRKINEGLVHGGPDLMVQTVSQLTGIEFDYWALTSFLGFATMVNRVGGLDIEVLYPMYDSLSGTSFDPGEQTLTGSEALAFSRDRHSAPGGDFGRSENQGRVMLAALEQLHRQYMRDPKALFRWMSIGLAFIRTDLPLSEVLNLGFLALQVDPDDVTNLVVPGTTGAAGAASVVFLSPPSGFYADLADDAIIQNPPD
ncbi:MAG: LCP family protein [Actinomycetota bacterium]